MPSLDSFGLASQPSSSVSSSDLEGMGKRAAFMFLSRDVPLSDAVVKIAQESPGITSEQVKRVVEYANQHTFMQLFEKQAGDKNIDFTIADPYEVLKQLNDGVSPPVVKTAAAEYFRPPVGRPSKGVEYDIKLASAFGVELPLTPAMKKAAQFGMGGTGGGAGVAAAPGMSSGSFSTPPPTSSSMPTFEEGGVVAGEDGQEVPIRAHAGEVVVNPDKEGLTAEQVLDAIEEKKKEGAIGPLAATLAGGAGGAALGAYAAPEGRRLQGALIGGAGGAALGHIGAQAGRAAYSAAKTEGTRYAGARVVPAPSPERVAELNKLKQLEPLASEGKLTNRQVIEQVYGPTAVRNQEILGGLGAAGAAGIAGGTAGAATKFMDWRNKQASLTKMAMDTARSGTSTSPRVRQDLEKMASLENIKAACNTWSYPSEKPYRELFGARTTLMKAAEEAEIACSTNQGLMKEAQQNFHHHLEQFLMQGGNLGEASQALAAMASPQLVKAAMKDFQPNLEKLARSYKVDLVKTQSDMIRYEMSKVACESHRVANPDNPLLQSWAGYVKLAANQRALDMTSVEVRSLLKEANSLCAAAARR